MGANPIQVEVRGKQIQHELLNNVFTQGEMAATEVIFTLDRIWNGVDIGQDGMSYFMSGLNSTGQPALDVLVKGEGSTPDKFTLKWTVSSQFTSADGILKIWINAIKIQKSDMSGSDEVVLFWKSTPARLHLHEGIMFSEYVSITERLLLEVIEAVAEAQTLATNASNSAHNASTSETNARGSEVSAKESAESAAISAQSAEDFAAQAQQIKDSTEVEYNVQPYRVGFKRKNEQEFTYTEDLKGDKGERGDDGTSLKILGTLDDPAKLPQDAEPGDAYLINGNLWVRGETAWIDAGNITGPKGDKGDKGDTGNKGDKGDKGDTGNQGKQGEQGPVGLAATISVGTVTTGDPNTSADVINSGTENAAKFDFTIPRGERGEKGERGADGTGVRILGTLVNPSLLPPDAELGDAYLIQGELWVWSGDQWVNAGNIQGPAGADGNDGKAGNDGREIALQISSGYIQWQYAGDINWTNLVALADLKGDTGATGAPGPTGAPGYTPVKGVDYFDGTPGKDGRDGLTTSVNGIQQVDGNITLAAADVGAATPQQLTDAITAHGESGTTHADMRAEIAAKATPAEIAAAVAAHNTDNAAHTAQFAAKLDKSGGTMTGPLVAGGTQVEATAQTRNGVILPAGTTNFDSVPNSTLIFVKEA